MEDEDDFDDIASFGVVGLLIDGVKAEGYGNDYDRGGVLYDPDTAHVGLVDSSLDLYGLDWVADKIADYFHINYDGEVELDGYGVDFFDVDSINFNFDGRTITYGIPISTEQAVQLADAAGKGEFGNLCLKYYDKPMYMNVQPLS